MSFFSRGMWGVNINKYDEYDMNTANLWQFALVFISPHQWDPPCGDQWARNTGYHQLPLGGSEPHLPSIKLNTECPEKVLELLICIITIQDAKDNRIETFLNSS